MTPVSATPPITSPAVPHCPTSPYHIPSFQLQRTILSRRCRQHASTKCL